MSSRAVTAWTSARRTVRRRARSFTANVVSLAGLASVCIGIGLWSIPLALVSAGVLCVIVAQGIEAQP